MKASSQGLVSAAERAVGEDILSLRSLLTRLFAPSSLTAARNVAGVSDLLSSLPPGMSTRGGVQQGKGGLVVPQPLCHEPAEISKGDLVRPERNPASQVG